MNMDDNILNYHEYEFKSLIKSHAETGVRSFNGLIEEEKLELIKHYMLAYPIDASEIVLSGFEPSVLSDTFLIIANLKTEKPRLKSCIELFNILLRNACENIEEIVNVEFEKIEEKKEPLAIYDPDCWKNEDDYLTHGKKAASL